MLNGEHDSFHHQFFGQVPPEQLAERREADLAGVAASHRDLGQDRLPGQDLVRVISPTQAREGWTVGGTLVQTITDDRPFLVDSVRTALERRGHRVYEVIHPIFNVARDEVGALQHIGLRPADDRHPQDDESWMSLRIGRLHGSAEADEIVDLVRTVLEDTRNAVEDWSQMSALMWQAANHVGDREAAELLRWLTEDEFTFLGRVRYVIKGDEVVAEADSALGIARHYQGVADLPLVTPDARRAWHQSPVLVTEGPLASTIRSEGYHDMVTVKVLGEDGTLVAEERFVGMLAATFSTLSAHRVPVLRRIVDEVLSILEASRESHAGRAIVAILNGYPRRALFHADPRRLATTVVALRQLSGSSGAQLHVEVEPLRRYATFMVHIPRERYSTRSRLQITEVLREAIGGVDVQYHTQVTNSPMAALHFTIRVEAGEVVPAVDQAALRTEIDKIGRDWGEDFQHRLEAELGEERGDELATRYRPAFGTSYTDAIPPKYAVNDAQRLAALDEGGIDLHLYRPSDAAPGVRRLKLYLSRVATLSDLLPVFNDLGVVVTDEHPYVVNLSEGDQHLLDLGLASDEDFWQLPDADERFQQAVLGAWRGEVDSDRLQSLVLAAGLTNREVVVLRAITAYLRQLGMTYSAGHAQHVLCQHPTAAHLLVDLFAARFDPDEPGGLDPQSEDRTQRVASVLEQLEYQLDEVPSLDHETILGNCRDVVMATLRTNWFIQTDSLPLTLTLKLAPKQLDIAPEPRPHREIFVHGPRVEGVHLRFGSVARGGLRWSDRREDFRTEVLGLVKAQVVKNAVIVPAGAKGGFFAKLAPTPAHDRDGWLSEGQYAYRQFIASMLAITDNRVEGEVRPPDRVVRHDQDDPYLVVAADKGTASFSDLANKISVDEGFWLGDAFASGGSVGFDHKAMGITARGAWESVRRHFRERGLDTQAEDFTAVGIGDMSGDVFGNGMLRSRHIRLVAAFDHRHVFIDPSPDAASSFAERQRLFELPRSSWADYDRSLISAGGGVWSRDEKSIRLSDEIRTALQVDDCELSPAALISAVLRAPVDLLWNGGIGTYVRARQETDAQVGDRANDAVRVPADTLRCRVIGEGGNLGLTQRARIEAALAGIGVNTDAIDNSAGVDTSDHEVNIKIVLDQAVRDGVLSHEHREALLADLVDPVARAVLRTNYEQNVLIGNARAQDGIMVAPHLRLLAQLEREVGLDRHLELLPTDAGLVERERQHGRGLSAPEFAVVLAWTKIALKQRLSGGPVLGDPFFEHVLLGYFPDQVRTHHEKQVLNHPLRGEITAMVVANQLVNRGGVTFAFRAQEETGAPLEDVVRAFTIARQVFDLDRFVAQVEQLDNQVSTDVQADLYLAFRRLLDHVVRRLLLDEHGSPDGELTPIIDRYRPVAPALQNLKPHLVGGLAEQFTARVSTLVEHGVGHELATWAAGLSQGPTMIDVAELATSSGESSETVLAMWFALVDDLQLDGFFAQIAALRHEDRWDAMARAAIRSDAHRCLARLTGRVLQHHGAGPALERVEAFLHDHEAATQAARQTLSAVTALEPAPELAALTVALRSVWRLVEG